MCCFIDYSGLLEPNAGTCIGNQLLIVCSSDECSGSQVDLKLSACCLACALTSRSDAKRNVISSACSTM